MYRPSRVAALLPEQTRRGAVLQMLVDRALDVVQSRLDEVSRHEAPEHIVAMMRACDPGPLHIGGRIGQLAVRAARDGS